MGTLGCLKCEPYEQLERWIYVKGEGTSEVNVIVNYARMKWFRKFSTLVLVQNGNKLNFKLGTCKLLYEEVANLLNWPPGIELEFETY